jgi:hypothetical protein
MSSLRLLGGSALQVAAVGLPLTIGACGERSADPIVRVASNEAAGGASESGAGEGPTAGSALGGGGGNSSAGSAAGGSGGTPVSSGPVGLCGACRGSDECGDANDACIRHDDTRFCGRDCFDSSDCPDGYACVELTNSQLFQCVPETSCPEPPSMTPTLDEIRGYLLERINSERAARDNAQLAPSSCLDQLAQESALSFARTDEPLGKFVKECEPIWPSCDCGWTAEAEIAVAAYALDWRGAADQALGLQRNTDNDRFVQAYRGYDASDVGIGFWLSGDEAWIALSFR